MIEQNSISNPHELDKPKRLEIGNYTINDLKKFFPKFKKGDAVYWTDPNNINCCAIVHDIVDGSYLFYFIGHYEIERKKYYDYKRTSPDDAVIFKISFHNFDKRYNLGSGKWS